ncbi:MAG: alpha/beta fold hydrolase [Acidobacteriota bacterium]|nr:alpha/beta fold hydrolase [Acidobacteriota bacterium]
MSRDITAVPPIPADQRHAYGADVSQFFDLFLPASTPGSKPRGFAVGFLLMIHGGFWRARYDLTHASHLCAALSAAGIATASLEYRRVGKNDGSNGNAGGWPASFDDVRAGLAAARQHFAAPPVVVGHSAGGHLALRLAAATSAMKGVVALAPVADLQLAYDLHLSHDAVVGFLGGTPAEKPEAYAAADAARHASAIPRTLIHGTHDDVVPIALSQSFLAQRRADHGPVELVELADAGHLDLIDPQAPAFKIVLQSVLRFA